MERKEKELTAKETFFKDFYDLDDETTEDEMSNEAAMMVMSTREKAAPEMTPEQKSSVEARQPTGMGQTMSSPILQTRRLPALSHATSVVQGPPSSSESMPLPGGHPAMPPGSRKDEAAGRSNILPTMSKAPRKRKRGQSLQPIPESQQIFKGKSFYFLPNDNIAPARALRIRKAQEWGALWIRDWKAGITHVVVDNGLCYRDVIKYLKLSVLPAYIVLINETYPSDCITFRFLVNPLQQTYFIDGQREAMSSAETPTSTESSLVSLQLTPNKAKNLLKTPSRTEGSDEMAATRHLEVLGEKAAEMRAERSWYIPSRIAPKSALDEAIEEAKAVEGLPLDSEEDEELSKSMIEDEDLSDEEAIKNQSRSSRPSKQLLNKPWQDSFSCMQKHDGINNAEYPNAHTIEILQKMADYYDRTRNQWRVIAYRKAIASLRKQIVKITTKAEALALPFVGNRLAEKIEEIVSTNRLRRLDNANADDPEDSTLQLFLGIHGVGLSTAQAWIAEGHTTLTSLSASASLTPNQIIGLEHYTDFHTRIPRPEVGAHAVLLREHVAAVDPTIEVTIGGSYRRGAADCGDIDFLFTSQTLPISALRTLLIDSLVPRLFAARYLRATLATTNPNKGTKWQGAACLPTAKKQIWRRVDFLLVPWEEMGAALIYWTGNDIFNRSMRLLASKKGMRLNQRGLYKNVLRGPGRTKVTEGELVEGRSERAIFERLGVPWRPPEHRIC